MQQLNALSVPELTAVVTAIVYLLLAIRQNIWCWAFSALSSVIYVYLFVVAKLYMESLLYAYYFGMAIYGWRVWRRGGSQIESLPVSVWPLSLHAAAIAGILALSACSGWLLAVYTDAKYPYVDSLTTWSAFWAMYLMAKKLLENWWYWLVIDIASIVIYWLRDLQLTALLYCVYVIMIPAGIISWQRSRAETSA